MKRLEGLNDEERLKELNMDRLAKRRLKAAIRAVCGYPNTSREEGQRWQVRGAPGGMGGGLRISKGQVLVANGWVVTASLSRRGWEWGGQRERGHRRGHSPRCPSETSTYAR